MFSFVVNGLGIVNYSVLCHCRREKIIIYFSVLVFMCIRI